MWLILRYLKYFLPLFFPQINLYHAKTSINLKDKNYLKTLESIKNKISKSRFRANLSVNVEMICLYWHIGKEILDKQGEYGWGSKVIDNLSSDLLGSFPDMKGLSVRNLKYMRQFAEVYADFEFVQQVAAQIPWFHNVVIMEGVKDQKQRSFYIEKSIENGWSRSVLSFQIESNLYSRQIENKNEKITNFEMTLPKQNSELALEMMKDPYRFDFLGLSGEVKERDLQKNLVSHMKEFLLELGTGFAFVGEEYHLEIGGEDFYIDLLFYNLKLRCYVVIELKVDNFKPEYLGKLNFYTSAIDHTLKHKDDNPSIGLLLCKNKNKTIAKYSLENFKKPIGVAEYTYLSKGKNALPSIEEIEAELNRKI